MSITPANAGVQVYIGLGSNLGDSRNTLESSLLALEPLAEAGTLACSSFYASAPMGPTDQPDYLNAVCGFRTGLHADALLAALQQIEQEHGRVRDGTRWGPRTLDLDLLVYGTEQIDSVELKVPHPGIGERAFVLLPLLELAPTLHIPGLGAVAELARHCRQDGIERLHSD